jgi:signal transduction histidine kinase
MRARLVISTIAIILVVIGTLAVPIGLIVYNAAEQQLDSRLEDQVAAITALISMADENGDDLDLQRAAGLLGTRDGLQIWSADGRLVADITPTGLESTRSTSRVASEGSTVVVLTDASPLDENFRDQLNILIGLAVGAIIAAGGLAAVQAHQLARPLERLAARIGDGDFSGGPSPSTHIPEIDHIATALDSSSQRVDTMLSTERHFTADATHQLRTGITGIAMRLEILTMHPAPEVASEAAAGLAQTDQLNSTIDELLAVARDRSTREQSLFDLTTLVNDHADEWRPRYESARRHISVITSKSPPLVFGTKGLAGQVVDILIDNALRHGSGSVTLMIDGPSVVVIDQGQGMPPDKLQHAFDGPVDPAARHGRGLPLARRLAQVDGAELTVVGNRPLRVRYSFGHRRPSDNAALSA